MDIPSPCPYCLSPPKVVKSGACWRVACSKSHLTHLAVRPMKSRRSALEDWEVAVSELLCQADYTGIKRLADGRRCGLMRMLYTHALAVNVSLQGHEYRYCFEHLEDAQASLQAWNGEGHPSGPWIVCKGKGVNLLNTACLDNVKTGE